jgi:hypothetical protein
MRLDLALMTEAAGRMVAGEAAGLAEENREGIRSFGCLRVLLRSQV